MGKKKITKAPARIPRETSGIDVQNGTPAGFSKSAPDTDRSTSKSQNAPRSSLDLHTTTSKNEAEKTQTPSQAHRTEFPVETSDHAMQFAPPKAAFKYAGVPP